VKWYLLFTSIFTDLRNVYTCLEVPPEKPFVRGKTAGSGCSFALFLCYDTLDDRTGYNSGDETW
jgi:hypothetical protein